MKHRRISCLLAFIGAAGCASTTLPPNEAKIEAHNAVQTAELADTKVPEAESRLALARSDIAKGDKLLADGDYELARFYFERGEAAAEAAIAFAKAKQAEQLEAHAQARLQEEQRHEPDSQ